METKTCNACGCTFTPRPQNPNQKYCTNSECQRERRRRWQQQARQGDSDYRDNDIRSSKTWAAENPEYWKRYREENPAYVERNRNLQQQRNQKQRTTVIANEDVSHALINPPSGLYRMAQILEDGAIPDPAHVEPMSARVEAFEVAYQQLESRIKAFLALPLETMSAADIKAAAKRIHEEAAAQE